MKALAGVKAGIGRPSAMSDVAASIDDGSRAIVGAAIEAFDMLSATTELRDRIEENTAYLRTRMTLLAVPRGI